MWTALKLKFTSKETKVGSPEIWWSGNIKVGGPRLDDKKPFLSQFYLNQVGLSGSGSIVRRYNFGFSSSKRKFEARVFRFHRLIIRILRKIWPSFGSHGQRQKIVWNISEVKVVFLEITHSCFGNGESNPTQFSFKKGCFRYRIRFPSTSAFELD